MANAARTTTTPAPRTFASRYDELKAMLEECRLQLSEELHGRVRGIRAEGATRLRDTQDPGEIAEVDIQGDIEFALIQMKAETLTKVNEAMTRLEDGRYGYCFDCGEEISEARLRALLFAVRCRDCEGDREVTSARARAESRRESSGLFVLQR